MWSNSARYMAVGAAAFTAGILLAAPYLFERISIIRAADNCDAQQSAQQEKIDCWLAIPLDLVKKSGINSGFRAFAYLYDTYPLFASSGCHRHAHKVGDAAYYEFYIARNLELTDIQFPQETTTCGYGFFHGFIEHLIQSRPDIAFVADTCEYLRSEYTVTMRDIGTICYHASGHGFMQAQADALPKEMWGKPAAMIEGSLQECEKLPTNESEIEDCREGVFNVLVDWMDTGNYDLAFDFKNPLALCSTLQSGWQYACFYELGQNLGKITQTSPLKAAHFAESIPDTELRTMTFGVMIAGMMQPSTALNEYKQVLAECVRIADAGLYATCIVSSANGMMEHGAPGEEYKKVLDLCSDPALPARGGDTVCYDALARRLLRFYPQEKKQDICRQFPDIYRARCDTAS